jgi:DNA-binding MarR family transcriptional regulator
LQPTEMRRANRVCAFTYMRRANRAIAHLYDSVLSPTGLKASQFVLLRAIADAGEIAQCDLSEELVLSVEALSRRLTWARKRKLVSMRKGEHGRRIYALTSLGGETLRTGEPYWSRAQERLSRSLGNADWEAMCALLDEITTAAREAEAMRLSNSVNHAKVPPGAEKS